MSLKAQLRARVARCTPYAMQHATFEASDATANATGAQPQAANPRKCLLSDATSNATLMQLAPKADATAGPSCRLHAVGDATRNFRPYRLSPTEADVAHAEPWDDTACGRFTARVTLFLRRGINATDADDLAERLHLRDVRSDDRALCVECRHLAGRTPNWRCSNARAAVVGADLPDALVIQAQRCPGFADGAT